MQSSTNKVTIDEQIYIYSFVAYFVAGLEFSIGPLRVHQTEYDNLTN